MTRFRVLTGTRRASGSSLTLRARRGRGGNHQVLPRPRTPGVRRPRSLAASPNPMASLPLILPPPQTPPNSAPAGPPPPPPATPPDESRSPPAYLSRTPRASPRSTRTRARPANTPKTPFPSARLRSGTSFQPCLLQDAVQRPGRQLVVRLAGHRDDAALARMIVLTDGSRASARAATRLPRSLGSRPAPSLWRL